MSSNSARILLGAILLSATLPAAAQAQIYSWRDAEGRIVLSDKPNNAAGMVKTYPTQQDSPFRTTTKGIVNERAAQYDVAHRGKRHGPRRQPAPRAGRHSAGVGVQPQCAFAQRGDGPDAADARHGN